LLSNALNRYFFNYNSFRCEIPQCDIDNPSFNVDWLNMTIPFNKRSNEPYKCLKYHYIPRTVKGANISTNGTCMQEAFNVNRREKCDKWVFEDVERTIVNDVSRRPLLNKLFRNTYLQYLSNHINYFTHSLVLCARKTNGNSAWSEPSTVLVNYSVFLYQDTFPTSECNYKVL
jgi:hypothetical protein